MLSTADTVKAYSFTKLIFQDIKFTNLTSNSDIKPPFLTSLPWASALVSTEVVLLPILKQVKSGLSSAPRAFGSTGWDLYVQDAYHDISTRNLKKKTTQK